MIGVLLEGAEPLGVGSAFVIDGGRRLLCSCGHLLAYMYELVGVKGCLDPMEHGVAVGFGQGVGEACNWQARAKVLWSSGAPSPQEPAALDLMFLQMTHHLDGSPVSERTTLASLPLGNSASLLPGDDLTLVGFGGQRSLGIRLRPAFGKLSSRREDASGKWLESLGMSVLSGHGGGPVIGPTGDVIGWQVRVWGRETCTVDIRPIEELEPALAAVLKEPELRGSTA